MKIYTVSRINGYIKNIIDSDPLLTGVVVTGEISNCKYHSMGHIYFTLKDDKSSMPCVMFKGNVSSGLKFKLEDGQAVNISGSISVYERDGRYQLYARKIELCDDGKGELFRKYEELKKKLYDEGLFEHEIKKPIPKYPRTVGIVTAETGAAIQDIRNVSKRRNPYVQLVLYPAKVQGEGAAATIARGIEVLDSMGLDTIIIGRGGGSLEDLWAFNEEIVARAIYNAQTPIISAVGHEGDTVISDYVADMRAPTPSAAAELAIPDVMSTIKRINAYEVSMRNAMTSRLGDAKLKLRNLEARLARLSPERRLNDKQQQLAKLTDDMQTLLMRKLEAVKRRYEVAAARLEMLSPTARFRGGYGYVSIGDKPVTGIDDVRVGDELGLILHDGRVTVSVTEKHEGF